MAKDLPQLNRIKSQSKAQLVIALQSLLLWQSAFNSDGYPSVLSFPYFV